MLGGIRWIAVSLLCTVALAEHDGGPGQKTDRRQGDNLDKQVAAIFGKKCQSCHYGDGKFNESDLPEKEWKEKVLASLNHKAGTKAMPPAAKTQLTEDEKKIINQWGGVTETSPEADVCNGKVTTPSANVVRGILSDRCVTCHGKLSFNPTSVLRSAHSQFLNNDGTLDLSNLGDMSEIQPYNMPKGKTSIPRILDALSGYTMPPRGQIPVINRPSDRLLPQVGTPHMTDGERQFLIGALKLRMRVENCAPKQFTAVAFTKRGRPVGATFAEAAKACENLGMHLPTKAQTDTSKAQVVAAVRQEGCVWTNTFDEDASMKDKAIRKILSFSNGGSTFGWATENSKCQALCVK